SPTETAVAIADRRRELTFGRHIRCLKLDRGEAVRPSLTCREYRAADQRIARRRLVGHPASPAARGPQAGLIWLFPGARRAGRLSRRTALPASPATTPRSGEASWHQQIGETSGPPRDSR